MKYPVLLVILTTVVAVHGSRSKKYTNIVRKESEALTTKESTDSYCFAYTWLKSEDNDTFAGDIGKKCQEKFSSSKPRPICKDPMVVTDNGEEPDLTWIYDNKFENFRCTLHKGSTCAKVVYYFNGEIQNVTKYCTKITVNEISMNSGCVTTSNGAHSMEVCACSGMQAGVPCNGSSRNTLTKLSLAFVFLVSILILR